jgi:serine/threonine protein kinase
MQLGPGSRIADRYTVVRPLARGGVAAVWLVRHDTLRIDYALKVLNVATTNLGERLVNEARVQATLQHSNVVRAVDVVTVPGGVGIVLEYVAGPSLRTLLAHRRLSPLEVHLLFRGIAAGVACAHRAGLVHRDLKPANVLLQVEPELVPKVTDFGLAKVFVEAPGDRHATRTGSALGTPAYMAPEQVRDSSRVDARADVFALGTLAYEMLTGRRAFEGEDTADTLTRVKEVRYVSLSELLPDAPPRMVSAIEGALVADPARRLASVDELLERWGDDVVPPAVIAGLRHDLGAMRTARMSTTSSCDSALIDQTWSEPRSGQTQTSWNEPIDGLTTEETTAVPHGPGSAALGAFGASSRAPMVYGWVGFGLGAAAFALLSVPLLVFRQLDLSQTPPAAQITLNPAGLNPAGPTATPSQAQKAVQELTFLLTDVGTESIRGQKDLQWLRHTLPAHEAEADRKLAELEARFPDNEVVLQARYQAAMMHFLSYTYRAWVQIPPDLPDSERHVWEQALQEEIRPGAQRALQEARARFDALAHTDHPAAPDSLWPRMGRQMTAQIDNIPPQPR